MTRQEFAKKVNQMIPSDTKILRSITLAQAIIESADGQGVVANSSLTKLGNALFGIKATKNWKGKSINCKTREVYPSGEWHGQAAFRAYDSWQESVINHEYFLVKENPCRYKNVIGETDYNKVAQALQSAGYATDPNYAKTIISVINREKLYLFDSKSTPAIAPTVTKPPVAPQRTYKVKPGDSWWRIAQRQLGNGNRYEELAKFNGMTSKTVIHPNQIIKLP